MGLHMGISLGEVDELHTIKAGDREIWKYDPSAPPVPSAASFAALAEWEASGHPVFLMPGTAVPAYNYTIDDRISWPTQVTSNQTLFIKAKNIFGGEESEGGIDGTLDVMFGAPDQPVNSRLQQMLGGLVPAYRKRLTVFFDGLICAMSKYPKPWAFRVRRNLKGWDGGVWYASKCIIELDGGNIKAQNPAHIIYECLTNRDWGRGHARAKLDDAAFRACADVLFDEGFGLCLKWSRQDKIGNFIQIVLNHIGANLFVSRTTGLWTLRLVRDDYDTGTIPHFDADTGLLGVDDDDNAASVVGANELVVNYTRPADNSEGSVRVQNSAAVRAAGGVLSETVDYSGIPIPELALRVAQRDLRAKYGVKKFKVRLNRRGYKIEPGGVFSISDPSRGIANLVLRAGRIEDGALSAGTITISAAMDVFGLPANSYVAVQPPLYTPPSFMPEPVAERLISEATYRDLVGIVDSATFSAITPGTNFITTMGVAPSGLSYGYQLDTRVAVTDWKSTDADFTPSALITTAITKGADNVVVTFANAMGIDSVVTGGAVLINTEIFRLVAINKVDGTATLARGCVDTVPVDHAAGSRIWFYQDGIGVDTTEYAAGITVQARMLTKTGAGKLNVESAPIDSHTLTQRRERPYPPGNLKLNDVAYPQYITGALTISWSHRDRTLQADQLIGTSMGNVGPELGTAYKLKVSGEIGTPIVDTQPLTTSHAVSLSEEFSSGRTDSAPSREIRIVGLGTVSSAVATSLTNRADSTKVEDGWMRIAPGASISGGVDGYFIDGTTGAVTNRNFSPAWGIATQAVRFALNSSVYVSMIEDDPYNGWAVNGLTSELSTYDRYGGYVIRDRRLNARHQMIMTTSIADFNYWITNRFASRVIYRLSNVVHNVTKSAVVSGPLVSSARHALFDYYSADMTQFNDPSVWVGAPVTNTPDARLQTNISADVHVAANLSVIFGSLMYAVAHDVITSESTSGKSVNITNALASHITIATSFREVTRVYSIDLDGNVSLLGTRDGIAIADQVSSTVGVEIVNGTIRTVDSVTGAQGGVIATLPSSTKAIRVTGDTATSTFYVVAENGYIYHYNLSGTLLASMNLNLASLPDIRNGGLLSISLGYVYFGWNMSGQVRRINKDLSGYSTFYLATVTGNPNKDNAINVVSDTNSPEMLAAMLLSESAASTSVSQLPTSRVNDLLTIELSSVRDSLDSHQKHSVAIKRQGWGLRWGESWEV